MEDRCDVVVEIAVAKPHEEFVLVDVFGDLAVDQIGNLVRVRQVVHGEDRRLAACVEGADEIGANESRSAGDDGVHVESSFGQSSRSMRPTLVVTIGTRGATAQRSS